MNYLQDRAKYEDRYDTLTIELCRDRAAILNKSFCKLEAELPPEEFTKRQGAWYLQYSMLFFGMVESLAAKRFLDRETTITKWMQDDVAKDQRLNSTLLGGLTCRNCGSTMEVLYSSLHSRKYHKDEQVLFILSCTDCNQRSVRWQDGSEWEGAQVPCQQCGSIVQTTHKNRNDVITTTYTCEACGHSWKEMDDYSDRRKQIEPETEADPDLAADKGRFVFDHDTMARFRTRARHLQLLERLQAEVKERDEHADVYDTIANIKRLKIAELSKTLSTTLAEQHYTGFQLGQPQLGVEVVIEFHCLDDAAEREEYVSKNDLRKLLTKTLEDTNWRLMSEGVRYRLGYLSGRLKAYEREDDLRKLIDKQGKITGRSKLVKSIVDPELLEGSIDGVPIWVEKAGTLPVSTKPAKMTQKSSKKKSMRQLSVRGILHHDLCLLHPPRKDDESVPKFARTFSFVMSGKDSIPKV